MVTKPEAAAGAAEPLLSVDCIEAAYGTGRLALHGASLAVAPGQIEVLLGANGAGKSTLLKAISGLLPVENGAVTRGDIRFEGKSIKGLGPASIVRHGIVQVMEGRRIFGTLTCEENLRLGSHTRRDRRGIRRDMEQVYAYFPRLQGRTGPAGFLSGGEQQMLAIGRALMARPKLMLLDEPSMGLSPILKGEVFGIIRQLRLELGLSVLLVEQHASRALRIASRGYVLERGRVVLAGSAAELESSGDVKRSYLGWASQLSRCS